MDANSVEGCCEGERSVKMIEDRVVSIFHLRNNNEGENAAVMTGEKVTMGLKAI
jgi:hypothetical protein